MAMNGGRKTGKDMNGKNRTCRPKKMREEGDGRQRGVEAWEKKAAQAAGRQAGVRESGHKGRRRRRRRRKRRRRKKDGEYLYVLMPTCLPVWVAEVGRRGR